MNNLHLIFGKSRTVSDVQRLLDRIDLEERHQCLQLSTHGDWANGQVRIRFRVRVTVRDLILLWEIRESLPFQTRLFIEDLYEKRVSRVVPRCLAWEDYRDKLYLLAHDDPWKVGRAGARLLYLLRELRVFIWQPPRAKKRARLRTPSAASGSGKAGGLAPKLEYSAERLWKEEQHRAYLEEQGRMLEEATLILAREKQAKMSASENQQALGGESPAPGESPASEGIKHQPEAGPVESLGVEVPEGYRGRDYGEIRNPITRDIFRQLGI